MHCHFHSKNSKLKQVINTAYKKGTRALPVCRQLCIGDILLVLKITKPWATSIYSFLRLPIKELNVVCKWTEALQQNNINNNVRLFDIYPCKICPTIVLLTDRTVHNAALKTLERKIALCRGFDINTEAKFGSVTCPNSLGRECLKNITYSWWSKKSNYFWWHPEACIWFISCIGIFRLGQQKSQISKIHTFAYGQTYNTLCNTQFRTEHQDHIF